MSYVHRAKKLARERGYTLDDQTDSRRISVLVNAPKGYVFKKSNCSGIFTGGDRKKGRTKDVVWKQVIEVINWGLVKVEDRERERATDPTDYFRDQFATSPFPQFDNTKVKD